MNKSVLVANLIAARKMLAECETQLGIYEEFITVAHNYLSSLIPIKNTTQNTRKLRLKIREEIKPLAALIPKEAK